MVARALRFNVTAPVQSTVPSWFAAQSDRTWSAPTTNTLQSQFPSVVDQTGSRQNIMEAYCGAAVDQSRGEIVLAANGGHGDYSGNEVYRLTIKSETPRWYRVTNPFPGAPSEGTPTDGRMLYSNGTPRSVHGWYSNIGANGKMYLAPSKGVWSTGAASVAVNRFRYADAIAAFGTTTLTSAQAVGYWDFLGYGIPSAIYNTVALANNWDGGAPTAYDKSTGLIWTQSATATANYTGSSDGFTYSNGVPCVFSINTATDTITRYNVPYPAWTWNNAVFTNAEIKGPSVIAHDLGVWIQFACSSQKLRICNVANITQTPNVVTTTGSMIDDWSPVDTGVGRGATIGAVYYKDADGKRFVLVWGNTFGSKVRKLTVPANPMTSTAADWVWSDLTAVGGVTPPNTLSQGIWTKFNLIDDMGVDSQGFTRSALVLAHRWESAAYVYKLPRVI